ncbi:MAG: hypothetical protein HFF42_07470 [Lawsonibacter sp.]|jgi:hypothetical protein|nr:hypothetical protein [Lawsonibacter sp.]
MDKKQREERRRQEDIALQRGLLWVAGAMVLEALLVLVNRFYINFTLTDAGVNAYLALGKWLPVLRNVTLIGAALALVWTVLQLKKGGKFGWPLIGAIALGAVSVCAHVAVKYQGPGMNMLFWLVAAWALLAMMFYIYQREFFLGAAACGMSVLGLWFARYGAAGRLESGLLTAGIAAVGLAALWLKKNGGVIPAPTPIQFLPKEGGHSVLLATCLASLAAMAAGLAVESLAYYLIFAMAAWLFALFVYYTVKLM